MEHRYDRRQHIQNSVLIHVNQGTYVSGVIQNISYGGLALKSSRLQCLKKNSLVRAALLINGRLVMLPSQVVRVDDDEAALMFVEQASIRKQRLNGWLSGMVCA